MDIIGTPMQIPTVSQTGLRWLYRIKNTSPIPVPDEHEEPLTFDANDGYYFPPEHELVVSEDEAEFLCQKRPALQVIAIDKQDGKGFRDWPPVEGGMRQGSATEGFSVGSEQDLDGFGGEHFRQQQQVLAGLSEQLTKTLELNAKMERRLAQVERKLRRKKKVAPKPLSRVVE